MSPQESPGSHVEIGGTLQLEFRLSLAGAKEAVTVSGAPPMVETQPSSISAVIDERSISDLPLNGRRFTDLSLLAPGVTQDPRGLTSSSNGDLAFGGIRGYQSSFLVDGADNNNGFFSQARGRYRAPYQFSNETVQEFRVSSNTYGAELGRAGGAVINVVTKSGSNHLHGTGFYFFRDNSLLLNRPSSTSSRPLASSSSVSPWAAPSNAIKPSSLSAMISTFSPSPPWCATTMAVPCSCRRKAWSLSSTATMRKVIAHWYLTLRVDSTR